LVRWKPLNPFASLAIGHLVTAVSAQIQPLDPPYRGAMPTVQAPSPRRTSSLS